MKRIYLLLVLTMMGFAMNLHAQSRERSTITIANPIATIDGDLLHIDFEVIQDGKGGVIRSGEALHIRPIYTEGGKKYYLPELLINGKQREPFYQREQRMLSHEEYLKQKPQQVIVYDASKPISISYSEVLKFSDAMTRDGKLEVVQYVQDCCNTWHKAQTPIMIGVPVAPQFLPSLAHVTFIEPAEERTKLRSEELTLSLNFHLDKYDILPDYMKNAQELKLVEDLSRTLSSDDTYVITKTAVEGYASPEAPYDYNLRLSDQRAKSMREYIHQHYRPFAKVNITATGMGEDWVSFEKLVVESNTIPHKDDVLNIIRSSMPFDEKDATLKELADGTVYSYLLREVYPKLRSTKVRVAYQVRAFTESEVAQVFQSRPQDLSQREIYLLAQKNSKDFDLEHHRSEFGKEYEVAYRYFGDDQVAIINAASAALVRGQKELAWEHLQPIIADPIAANNIGVYYWMMGEIERAAQYFQKAIEAGDMKAKANLQEMNRMNDRK